MEDDYFYVRVNEKGCIDAISDPYSIYLGIIHRVVKYLKQRLHDVTEEMKKIESEENITIGRYMECLHLQQEIKKMLDLRTAEMMETMYDDGKKCVCKRNEDAIRRASIGSFQLGNEHIVLCRMIKLPVSIKRCKAYPRNIKL